MAADVKIRVVQSGMRRFCIATALLLWSTVIIVQGHAQRPAEAISPQVLFKRLAPSIFVVEALDESGEAVALGSGVALRSNEIITNAT